MNINIRKFVRALSLGLDFMEKSMRDDDVSNHGKRVCLIAQNLGQELQLSTADMHDLFIYALLHDCGFTHTSYNLVAQDGYTQMETIESHCTVGEAYIRLLPFLNRHKNILLYHHEFYNGTGFFKVKRENIPLLSQIICFSDVLEIVYQAHNGNIPIIEQEFEKHIENGDFSPRIVAAYRAATTIPAFWFKLDDFFVEEELKQFEQESNYEISFEDLLKVSKLISKIVDAKSPFTGSHSQGIAEKAEAMADFYSFDPMRKVKFIMAAALHDVGKLATPNVILDKEESLTDPEFRVIQSHTFYTRKILEANDEPEFIDIIDWASDHHEKLNGKGYPYGKQASQLPFETRLMTCIDIFQALSEERPYRKALAFEEVRALMLKDVERGEIDAQACNDVLTHLCY